ncbi:MAG: glutamate-5-semialdehyde dehydrogenase [Butyrivibrio sp.]|nr:glutamate-5-semialdehyde dehydrogenase [Butyrivibrio sp.]
MVNLNEMGQKACVSKYELQKLSTEVKNKALMAVADALCNEKDKIIAANVIDVENGEKNGMAPGMVDRLRLDDKRIAAMAEGLRQVAELPDPVGEVIEEFERPNGLKISKCRVPMGVIGIIYESRPNVTADAFSLTFKSGNATILKGGSDAIESNKAITEVIRDCLSKEGINPDAIQLIADTDREVTKSFMKLDEYVDVLIPRGSAGLIRSVVTNSTIPVIETGTGNCHIYVDKDADLKKALPIIINAKTQRIGVCNAAESLVIHEDINKSFLPELNKAFKEKNVEVHADMPSMSLMTGAIPATEEDFGREYLDYKISVKTVSDVEEAIEHINKYNTGHSEAIITENADTAERFLNGVDAACVYVNASTRFTDGFEFGFGAEIGISTQKLHARGPMGLRELTSYKYKIIGNGQIRS